MDNAPEKKSGDSGNGESRITNGQELTQYLRELMNQKIKEIETSDKTPEQKEQAKSEIAARAFQELKDAVQAQNNFKEEQKRGETVSQEQQKDAAKKTQKTFINALVATDKGLEVVKNKQAQAFVQQLAKNVHNDEQAGEIADHFGEYLTGDKPIIISERSDFVKELKQYYPESPVTAGIVYDSIVERAADHGKTEAEVREPFKDIVRQADDGQINQAQYEAMREAVFDRDRGEYYGRFTQEHQEFLHNLYSPTKFRNYVEKKIISQTQEQKDAFKKRITEVFQQQEKPIPNEVELERLADSRLRQKVSNDIGSELGAVINQLLLRLQQEGANKFYDELVQEDFMRGIRATENQIINALTTLHASLAELEKKDPNYDEKIKLYKFFDRGHYSDEREKVVDQATGEKKTLSYARLYPLLQPKEIGLKDFATQLYIDMNHLFNQRNYLHDARVVFNHPPGEKGFYGNLAGYAEKYKGTDIDEMMLLPDAPLALEAFHLYEKYLEEDFALLDWRHRPTEFQTRLEYINTQLEDEIIEQMKSEYGVEISEDRIRAAVNIGTGMARGVFLTEPEKSAYADPVDAEGTGLFASYGTNDAGALNVFNPLHTALRWQSEALLPLYYFMPFNDKTGGGYRGLWDHKKMFDEAAKYFDSFKKGGGYLKELKGKGERLFFDDLIDICNVGGVAKRRGWRMQYALEGHIKYKDIDLGGGKKINIVDALESFKAMDAIGYEAIADFLFNNKRMGEEILKAGDGTVLGKERREFFKYVFDRYFTEFEKVNFDSYMKDLYKLGEAEATHKWKTEGTMPAGSFEVQAQLEASNIFLERAMVREVISRFPTKFLRMDRNRFNESGVSRWQQIQKEMGMERDHFDKLMKDFIFTESLFSKDISRIIKDQLAHDPTLDLHKVKNLPSVLNEATIERLLSQIKTVDKDGNLVWNTERIENVKKLYRTIRKKFFENKDFLNKEASVIIKDYTFTFGLEDTDLSLIAFRGTGPRMIARAIGDIGNIESNVIPGLIDLPKMLKIIATNGKNDFSPLIEYMQKAQKAIQMIHSDVPASEFVYKVAAMTIAYFKKDSAAKPLFGLLKIGQKNSMAAEDAGRSSAVWEWDSRDIDRFCVALESLRLLPKEPYLLHKKPEYNDRYINIFGKPVKFGKKRVATYYWNAKRLRKEFGGDWKAISFDMINQFLPIALAFLLWQYFKKAMEEAEGKKK
ncbi:MAG: hypothetical protein V1803_00390 [Candidatus Roizmanbacteria bacterium]